MQQTSFSHINLHNSARFDHKQKTPAVASFKMHDLLHSCYYYLIF